RPGGARIIAENARIRADLDETIVVDRLPARIGVTRTIDAPLAEALAWSRRIEALAPPADVAAALFHLGEAVDREGLAATRWPADPLDPGALRPWIEALHRRAAKREHEDA